MSFIPKNSNKTQKDSIFSQKDSIFSRWDRDLDWWDRDRRYLDRRDRDRDLADFVDRNRRRSARSWSREASIAIAQSVDRDHDRRRSAQFRWSRSRSWCVGVDRSVWLGVWVGAVKLWERQCVSERGGKRLKWKYGLKLISIAFGLIYGQTENIFSLTEFTMPTKHVIFRKMISEFCFQPKQTNNFPSI